MGRLSVKALNGISRVNNQKHTFHTAKQLGNILDEMAKEMGFPPVPPMIGSVELKYQIGDRKFKGSFGVFVGEYPAEQVEEYRLHVLDSFRNYYRACRATPFNEADAKHLDELNEMAEKYTVEDVQVLEWDFTSKK